MQTWVAGSSSSAWHGPGRASRAVFRTIVLYRATKRAFFVYGFAKNERDNIDDSEEAAFRKSAGYVLELSEEHLAALIGKGHFTEVRDHGEEVSE